MNLALSCDLKINRKIMISDANRIRFCCKEALKKTIASFS